MRDIGLQSHVGSFLNTGTVSNLRQCKMERGLAKMAGFALLLFLLASCASNSNGKNFDFH